MRRISAGLRDAMHPLVLALRGLAPADRRAWLDELHSDAPALAEVLERVINEAATDAASSALPADPSPPDSRSTP